MIDWKVCLNLDIEYLDMEIVTEGRRMDTTEG